jgi:predicted dehydrogenase
MKKIKAGIIGVGFISAYHIDALRRIGLAELEAITDANYEMAKTKAEYYGVSKCYREIEELINDPEIQVVHNCTEPLCILSINRKIIRLHIYSLKSRWPNRLPRPRRY